MPGRMLFEKIWTQHIAAELSGGLSLLSIDRHFLHDLEGGPNFIRLEKLGYRVTQRKPVVVKQTPTNAPGVHQRVNQRSPIHSQAHPINIGHVVVFAADFAAMRSF